MNNFRSIHPATIRQSPLPATLLLLVAFALLLVASSSNVQAATNFNLALVTDESSSKAGYQGGSAVYELLLTNTSSTDITLQLSAASTQSYALTITPAVGSNFTLSANSTRMVTVLVAIPNNATIGDVDTTTITAIDQNDSTETEQLALNTTVYAPNSINVDLTGGGTTQTGSPNAELTYNYTVRNSGSATADFDIVAESDEGYSVTVTASGQSATGSGRAEVTVTNLAPNATSTISVKVQIASSAVNGERDTLSVGAFASLDPSVFDLVSDTVQVSVATPTATATGVLLADANEPNNSVNTATTLTAGSSNKICNNTFWPIGDVDYFRFYTQAGMQYLIETTDSDTGLDPHMTLRDENGFEQVTNDNKNESTVESHIGFIAGSSHWRYVSIKNLSALDSTNKRYCIELLESGVTPSPTPTSTPTPTTTPSPTTTTEPSATPTLPGDSCEPNESAPTACPIEPDTGVTGDFENPFGAPDDVDYYQLWVKRNIIYSCATSNLSNIADTRMELRDQSFNWLGDNDDTEPNNPASGSTVEFQANYSGWLYIIVRPFTRPLAGDGAKHTYTLTCSTTVPTATPTYEAPTETPVPPTATPTPVSNTGGGNSGGGNSGSGSGGGFVAPTSTPLPVPSQVIPTQFPTPTPFELPTATPTKVVQVNPLPTPAPQETQPSNVTLDVQLYYDLNQNFQPEANEGITDVAVAVYDNISGDLLAFGYTNANGVVSFGPFEVSGALRVTIPFFNFNQVVSNSIGTLQMRISPQQLPNLIP